MSGDLDRSQAIAQRAQKDTSPALLEGANALESSLMSLRPDIDLAYLNGYSRGHLPELLGIRIAELQERYLRAEMPLRAELMAPNGFLHGGSVVALADTAAGYACRAHLPEGAEGFTTLELKTNFLATAREGRIEAEARAIHLGRSTQVWDVQVFHPREDGRRELALFRCTQLVLYPPAGRLSDPRA